MDLDAIKKKVDDKEKQFSELYTRMDEDFDLWNIKKRVFDSHKMSINITSNEPRALADKVQATLVAAVRQIQIKPPQSLASPEAMEAANKMERLFKFGFNQADLRLRKLLQPNLVSALSWFINVRGISAVRTLVYKTENGVVFDYLPLDPRWLTYAIGNEGLDWVGYKTYRSKESLKGEYNFEASGGEEKGIEVIEYWDRDINAVIAQDTFLKKPDKHRLSQIPIVIVPVTMRPRISDSSGLMIQGYGESIYAPNRLEYEQNDRLSSILATHAHLLAKAPIINFYDVNMQPKPIILEEPAYIPGAIINIPNTHKLDRLPTADIPQSLQLAIRDSRIRIQKASFADIEYGQDIPPHSGTALSMLREDRSKVLGPRIKALSDIYTDICYMVKEEVKTQGITVPTKVVEKDEYYMGDVTPEDLDNDFYIDVAFTSNFPWRELETLQLIQMGTQLGIFSIDTAREDIAKLPDARTEGIKVDIQRALEQSPETLLQRAFKGLVEQGRMEEAALIDQQIHAIAQQRQAQIEQQGMGTSPGVERGPETKLKEVE